MLRILRSLSVVIAIGLFATLVHPTLAHATPMHSLPTLQTPAPSGLIVVQFTSQATTADRARVAALAGAPARDRVDPSLLRSAAAKSATISPALAALARYVEFEPGGSDHDQLLKLVSRLAADPAVDTAFLEPRAVPAALGFDAFTGATPAQGGVADKSTRTEDFTGLQGYMSDAPTGIGSWTVWSDPGARGGSVRIIDVEGAWLWDHEDLPTPFADIGEHIDDLSWRNHGTAVMGEMRGHDNTYGVDGIVPDCQVGNSSIGNQSVAQALLAAAAELDAGDLALIELHAPGPNANGAGQYGYVPMEFWPDNFDAIRALTDMGIIVVEAAGNGQQDLDDPIYQGFFDRSQRDSGAIMVGATAGSDLSPAWFTNHGTRVDLCGWGLNVTTCGYGDLQSGDEIEWYTASFSGTSSASPIVTGAVASLQGMAEIGLGQTLDANLARTILSQTGTPSSGPELIGPRPDLVAARDLMQAVGVGMLTGTVTEAGSGSPLAGVAVMVEPDGPSFYTAADGTYQVGLLPDEYTISVSSYFHETDTASVTVVAGVTVHDVVLTLKPSEIIGGIVLDESMARLPGVTLALLGEPVATTMSVADGVFEFEPVPEGNSHELQAGGLPGYGGKVVEFPVTGLPGRANVAVKLPTVTWDFESGPQGWTAQGTLWQHGDPSVAGIGPGTAFDGSWCWGVGMDGEGYPDETMEEFWSPLLQGSDYSGEVLQLSLHYWSGTEANYDGVNVVLNPGPDELVLQPHGGYTDPVLGGLDYAGGWSGHSSRWQTAVFDISSQLGESDWRLAIRFGSDEWVTDEGFMVDAVTLHSFNIVTAVSDGHAPVPGTANLTAYPNPFNPQVTVAWSLPSAGRLDLDIFDLRGRLVAALLHDDQAPKNGTVNWNGRDSRGQTLASGVYLVRARGAVGPATTQRITLAR